MLPDANLSEFQGDREAEVVAAWEEPVADGIVDPHADAADDLRDARRSHAEEASDLVLLQLPDDDKAVDV